MAEYFEQEIQKQCGIENMYIRYNDENIKKSYPTKMRGFFENMSMHKIPKDEGGTS